MRTLVIANPIAGRGAGREAADALVHELSGLGAEVVLHLTREAGDAARTAADAEGTVDHMVVVGGDGTLNEVLNGLRDPSRTPLIQLSTGTANLLGRELGLSREPAAIAKAVADGGIRHLDLCTIRELGPNGDALRERRFLLVASCGFDAAVVEEIAHSRDGQLGFRSWVGPILRTLTRYHAPRLAVSLDGAEPTTAGMVIVTNVQNYGGLFHVSDRARPDSGRLLACLFTRARVPDLVRYFVAGMSDRVSETSGVVLQEGRRIRIDCAEAAPVEVDGDAFGATPVEIEIAPGVVPVLSG